MSNTYIVQRGRQSAKILHPPAAAILMSPEDFAFWQETNYLLKSPANASRLLKSIIELEAGNSATKASSE